MGIEPYLLSSSIIGVLAQRLVRKICPHCKVAYTPSLEELKQLNLKKKDVDKFYRGEGCSFCFQTGYKGRHGIYELMKVTSPIKKELMKNPGSEALRKIAQSYEMKSISQNGADLVQQGITTTSEVFRVARALERVEEV
jgi:general secretion pathway protein E